MMEFAFGKMNVCAFLADLLPVKIVGVYRLDAPNIVGVFGYPDGNEMLMVESSFSLCSVFHCFGLVEHAFGFAVDAQYRLKITVRSCSHIRFLSLG